MQEDWDYLKRVSCIIAMSFWDLKQANFQSKCLQVASEAILSALL